jgi:hypothetical protein
MAVANLPLSLVWSRMSSLVWLICLFFFIKADHIKMPVSCPQSKENFRQRLSCGSRLCRLWQYILELLLVLLESQHFSVCTIRKQDIERLVGPGSPPPP